eukprot:443923-Pyramimonas_sp.AAC.1
MSLLGDIPGPLQGWDASDARTPLRAELEAVIWATAWLLQAPLRCRQAPVCFYTDNMDLLRIYQGGYVLGVLLPANMHLDGITQI